MPAPVTAVNIEKNKVIKTFFSWVFIVSINLFRFIFAGFITEWYKFFKEYYIKKMLTYESGGIIKTLNFVN